MEENLKEKELADEYKGLVLRNIYLDVELAKEKEKSKEAYTDGLFVGAVVVVLLCTLLKCIKGD